MGNRSDLLKYHFREIRQRMSLQIEEYIHSLCEFDIKLDSARLLVTQYLS